MTVSKLPQVQAETPPVLWKVADVARFLQCSQSWVYKAAEAGTLPCVRIGAMLRFNPEVIRAFALNPSAQVIPIGRKA